MVTDTAHPVFETERMVARRWTHGDVPCLFAMYSDPDVTRFLTNTRVETVDEIHERLPRILGTYARYGPGYGVWAAERRSDGMVVGLVLLKALPGPDEEILTADIEVGWHLRRELWGMGYATEMGAGAIQHGFEHQGLQRIHAVVDPENTGSTAVATRLNMVPRGPTDAYYGGEVVELFTIDRAEWAGQRMRIPPDRNAPG